MHELRFHRGSPTSEELAAVVAVLTGLGRDAGSPSDTAPVSQWRVNARPSAGPGRPVTGGWRASRLPR
ncbi:hypothetical protein Val02_79910 [Virgisporangium aliadipatigenens]|uniref:Acyl-CoA carboxylase epsilon subunit n=1 Tax=Virgisporangium aliadipatigenens TaxID=741659 RepID=A0A8J3YWF4_9ACTN|nr:acyl-CoA carboxylase subunit epsilon [Virgisporangium aliadipatigenens]GIJ51105.1 hypothetical protein Val02_79910 [Virgisporangium aliadipatigenens]